VLVEMVSGAAGGAELPLLPPELPPPPEQPQSSSPAATAHGNDAANVRRALVLVMKLAMRSADVPSQSCCYSLSDR
jgi:hypothetical protein